MTFSSLPLRTFANRGEAEAVVGGGFHRVPEPRGEEAPGGPAGGRTGSAAPLGQEAVGIPGRHLAGGAGHLGARHHGRVRRRADQRAVGEEEEEAAVSQSEINPFLTRIKISHEWRT